MRRLLLKTPVGVRAWVADRAGDLAYRTMGKSRQNVLLNLRRVVGSNEEGDLDLIARQVFRTAAHNLIDLALLPAVDVVALRQAVRLVYGSWAYFDPTPEGVGVIVVTGHLGPFEQIPALLAGRGLRLKALTTRTTGRRRFSMWTGMRRAHGADVEEPTRTVLRNLMTHLESGGAVGLVVDCDIDGGGEPNSFFGERTSLPTVMVRLARQTGAAIVPTFLWRDDGSSLLSLGEPIVIERTVDRAGDLQRGMARVIAELERAIGRSPEQWVIFQRVWQGEQPGENA